MSAKVKRCPGVDVRAFRRYEHQLNDGPTTTIPLVLKVRLPKAERRLSYACKPRRLQPREYNYHTFARSPTDFSYNETSVTRRHGGILV